MAHHTVIPSLDRQTNGHLPYAVAHAPVTVAAAVAQFDGPREHIDAERLDLVQVAVNAIRAAQRNALAGLTTNPRAIAEQLHQAVDDAQAEHLARPEVGGFPIKQARGMEAFSTADQAMERALRLSPDPARTARALRTMLDMAIDEVGA